MANREACELYIEQQIEEGLEQGKTPYSIGKEISAWIEKVFETKIQPHTIEMRVHRQKQQKQKLLTDVSSDEPPDPNQEMRARLIKAAKLLKKQLGKQAQREESTAMLKADEVISLLRSIPVTDPQRGAAFHKVLNWLNENYYEQHVKFMIGEKVEEQEELFKQ